MKANRVAALPQVVDLILKQTKYKLSNITRRDLLPEAICIYNSQKPAANLKIRK